MNTKMKVEWLGSILISKELKLNKYPLITRLNNACIGLREDGVVVWKKVKVVSTKNNGGTVS